MINGQEEHGSQRSSGEFRAGRAIHLSEQLESGPEEPLELKQITPSSHPLLVLHGCLLQV